MRCGCFNRIYYIQISPFVEKYTHMYEFVHLLDGNKHLLCLSIVFLECNLL